jgi:hypothetical protein
MFAPSCYPPGNPEAFVNANLVLAIRDAGWQIDVITMADTTHWYPHNPEAWQGLTDCSVAVAERQRTFVNRLLVAFQTIVQLGHLVEGGRWALPATEIALRLINEKDYDVIISRALPPMAHLAALITAQKTGLPWIANWNDPVPRKKYPAPYAGGKGRQARMGFWMTRYFQEVAERAAWHTFPCERLRKYITGYLPRDISGKSSVVPHIALQSDAPVSDRKTYFTLMHAGSLRPPRSSEVFLRGVRLFRDKNKSLQGFSVVFIVDRPDDVRSAAIAHGVEDLVRIEKSRPYAEMPAVLATADVLVIIEALVEEGIFLPSKFVDYVRTGRPILAISPPVGTLADILTERGGGIAADGRRAEVVADAIQTMYEHWLNGTLDEQFGSWKLFPLYSSETVLGAYREIFARIGKG